MFYIAEAGSFSYISL